MTARVPPSPLPSSFNLTLSEESYAPRPAHHPQPFPALRRQAELPSPAIFFDNPGGTQIAQQSLDRITAYLTHHNSRSISRTWNAGDTIVVTRLDHDANITPWVLAAQERGVDVRWVDFDVEDGTLKLGDFAAALETRPRLVAAGYASNALGTINPVKKLVQSAGRTVRL